MKIAQALSIAGLAVLLAGCTTTGSGGPLAFSSGGTSSYIRALNGGIVSRVSGIQLDNSDQKRALEAEYRALEAAPGGQAVEWQGSDGIDGKVVAAAPYQVGSQNCRQYTHTLTVAGQSREARGVACRNDSGSWTPLT